MMLGSKVDSTESEDSVKNPYMQDFIMKNSIFHTQDLYLCTLDANLIFHIMQKCVQKWRLL